MVIVYDGDVLLQGTGTLLVTISMLFVNAVHVEWLLMLSLKINNFIFSTEVLTQNYTWPLPFQNKYYFHQWIAPTNPISIKTAPKPKAAIKPAETATNSKSATQSQRQSPRGRKQ